MLILTKKGYTIRDPHVLMGGGNRVPVWLQNDIADVPSGSSKNDKKGKGKGDTVKTSVSPQASSDMAQTSNAAQNNTAEARRGARTHAHAHTDTHTHTYEHTHTHTNTHTHTHI